MTTAEKAVQRQFPLSKELNIEPNASIQRIADELEALGSFEHIVWMSPSRMPDCEVGDEMIGAQDQGVIQLYRLIKAMLSIGYARKEISWTVVTVNTQYVDQQDIVNPVDAGVHGLIGSMAKEYPNWQTKLIDVKEYEDLPLSQLLSLPFDQEGIRGPIETGFGISFV
ncbi:hypothetical protein QO179_01830 [Bacillus stercoris]|nr:hypothetical protein [Bacillus stercoris]